jgi:hypothetical protein
MRYKTFNIIFLLVFSITACSPFSETPASPTAQPAAATEAVQSSSACPDLLKTTQEFYTANAAGQWQTALSYFTEDVIMVFWAEGINGHHMGQKVVIGKEQMRDALHDPGLILSSSDPDQPVFKIEHVVQTGKQLMFNLTPDRTHADGRPYDPYVVELIFSGCRIDIIKITERITWV